jgi:NAD(P)-dependent dehydrogenase (short-subunit alcohol dehydrogenase family)
VYCATKAAVKALSDGLRIDVAHSAVRVTNLKPGHVETHFSNVRFHGDNERADNVYKGIKPLTGDDTPTWPSTPPLPPSTTDCRSAGAGHPSGYGTVIVRK